jgi:hypothetical protein
MEEKDYRLVFVGNAQVGLIGLKEIFEELKNQKGKPGSDLKQMLVQKAEKKIIYPSPLRRNMPRLSSENSKSLWVKRWRKRGVNFLK